MQLRTLLRLPLGELLWRELKGAHLNVGRVSTRCVVGCAQKKELELGSVRPNLPSYQSGVSRAWP